MVERVRLLHVRPSAILPNTRTRQELSTTISEVSCLRGRSLSMFCQSKRQSIHYGSSAAGTAIVGLLVYDVSGLDYWRPDNRDAGTEFPNCKRSSDPSIK
jgi:hypothetical protein